jgi:aconitate hydratase
MTTIRDAHGARARLSLKDGSVTYFRLEALASERGVDLGALPFTVKILLENVLRHQSADFASPDDVLTLARWSPRPIEAELPFMPSRVVLQDFTGVPAVVDLAAMRTAVARAGGDPRRINPLAPADLVIDHSVQVDTFGSPSAFATNVALEYERNRERYLLLRWAQGAFQNLRVVPPGTGIVHQVNLEFLASVVQRREQYGEVMAFPDTLVGTDSHTTMINALGVLGWGVGGIEAEAVLLGQPLYQLAPIVVGCKLHGSLAPGVTATDLVLTLTQLLRKHGVVGKFVEFTGPGLAELALADRATIANMAPEYGATAGMFPVDGETLRYLRATGRDDALVDLVERYTKEQGLFHGPDAPAPRYSEELSLDLSTVETSLAGPKRPQDRSTLRNVPQSLREGFPDGQAKSAEVAMDGARARVGYGSVVIAAITSCTNTSNPSVMIGAGLLAKRALERGLAPKPYVKTSLSPGSRVVTDYLEASGLLASLAALRFYLTGYGCQSCIGNSGPLPDPVANAINEHGLVVAAVLSGNRNFEGRVHPQVRAAYLASPPLVVAYALAGTVDIDLTKDPLGTGKDGKPVYLKDIWPSAAEVREVIERSVRPDLFRKTYGRVFDGDAEWKALPVPAGESYAWDPTSTYIQEPPFFTGLTPEPQPLAPITDARVLVSVGDSVTTDHISPAGSIAKDGPAGRFLIAKGVAPKDFNSYGARRGNHEVMMRGTFGNVRLKNLLVPGKEGDWTVHVPSGKVTRIFEASESYRAAGVPLVVLAGKEYGTGSSRDWAAKGTLLLGVKAVIAESYERIHRSNLVGMGVLPLQYLPGETRTSLGLDGTETYSIQLDDGLKPRAELAVTARRADGKEVRFRTIARVDSPVEVRYLRHGGILQMVLRSLTNG